MSAASLFSSGAICFSIGAACAIWASRSKFTPTANSPLPPWNEFRKTCRLVRMTTTICTGLAVITWLASFGAWLFLWTPSESRETETVGLGLELVPILFISMMALAVASIWENPTRRKSLSFARVVCLQRGVAEDRLRDEAYIGASYEDSGKKVGSGSDFIGFIALEPDRCVLHLDMRDMIIPRERILEVKQVSMKEDSLTWFGVKVIALCWQMDPPTPPITLYVIAWGGETPFGIKKATDELFQRLRAWSGTVG